MGMLDLAAAMSDVEGGHAPAAEIGIAVVEESEEETAEIQLEFGA
jgi:hypothetical protein